MVSGVELATLLDFADGARASVITLSLLPFAAGEAEVAEERRKKQERDQRDRNRRTLAEFAAGDAALERQRRQQMGGVDRSAAGDGIDQLEVGKGEDDRERHHDRQDRQHHRKRDVTKALPGRRAVQHRRLIERRRYGLQARQQRDRHEGNAAPDIGGDQREPRGPGTAEKVDIGGAQVQHVHQQIRNNGKLRIVDPPERQRRQHRGHDPRQQHDGPQQALEREVVVQQQRQPEAEREFSEGGDGGIEHAVKYRVPPQRIAQQILEILKADENAAAAGGGVGERQPDAEAKRIGQEHQQQADRRREEKNDKKRLVVEQPRQPARLPMNQPSRRQRRHRHIVV